MKNKITPFRPATPPPAPPPPRPLAEVAAEYAEAASRYRAACEAEATWRDQKYLAWRDMQRLLDQLTRA